MISFETFKKEREDIKNFIESIDITVDLDFDFIGEESLPEEFHEIDENLGGLKTSNNILARMMRWNATQRAMLRISILYKSIYRAHEKLTTNEVKLQIKRDEISKIGGPEAKIKVAEIDAILEKLRLQREMIMQKKNDALEKIKNPGFFRAGAIFGLNQDMLDRLIVMKNTQEKIVVADIKMKSAQKVLTDNEINELKRRIISLKARDTKYTEELKRTEANIIKSMETEEVTGGDVEIKNQLDGVLRKIADVESDIARTKEEISAEKDEKKKEALVRSYVKDEKYLKTLDQEKNDIMVKAKEAILGSTSKES